MRLTSARTHHPFRTALHLVTKLDRIGVLYPSCSANRSSRVLTLSCRRLSLLRCGEGVRPGYNPSSFRPPRWLLRPKPTTRRPMGGARSPRRTRLHFQSLHRPRFDERPSRHRRTHVRSMRLRRHFRVTEKLDERPHGSFGLGVHHMIMFRSRHRLSPFPARVATPPRRARATPPS